MLFRTEKKKVHLQGNHPRLLARLLTIMIAICCLSPLGFGQPNVNQNARFKGQFGAQFGFGDTVDNLLRDDRPEAEPTYAARFYVRMIDLQLVNGGSFVLFQGRDNAGIAHFEIQVNQTAAGPALNLRTREDSGSFNESGNIPLPFGWQGLELQWAADATNGTATLFLNGTQIHASTNLNNANARIDEVRIGKLNETGSGNTGTIEIDDFRARKFTRIGTLCLTETEVLSFVPDWPARNVREQVSLNERRCPAAPGT